MYARHTNDNKQPEPIGLWPTKPYQLNHIGDRLRPHLQNRRPSPAQKPFPLSHIDARAQSEKGEGHDPLISLQPDIYTSRQPLTLT